jgi:hypothetical protein
MVASAEAVAASQIPDAACDQRAEAELESNNFSSSVCVVTFIIAVQQIMMSLRSAEME